MVGVPPPMYTVRTRRPEEASSEAVNRISFVRAVKYGSTSSVFFPMPRLTKLQ